LSGPEGSSNKRMLLCAADKPSPMPAELSKGNFVLEEQSKIKLDWSIKFKSYLEL